MLSKVMRLDEEIAQQEGLGADGGSTWLKCHQGTLTRLLLRPEGGGRRICAL
jgi:hypothetical protein